MTESVEGLQEVPQNHIRVGFWYEFLTQQSSSPTGLLLAQSGGFAWVGSGVPYSCYNNLKAEGGLINTLGIAKECLFYSRGGTEPAPRRPTHNPFLQFLFCNSASSVQKANTATGIYKKSSSIKEPPTYRGIAYMLAATHDVQQFPVNYIPSQQKVLNFVM